MERNTKGYLCLACGKVAGRYMLANEKEYGVRWGWFCLECQPYDDIGEEWKRKEVGK
jgi:hypothetical protein